MTKNLPALVKELLYNSVARTKRSLSVTVMWKYKTGKELR